MFLSYVHSFRAIAILFIVAGHAIWIFDWPDGDLTSGALADVLENGTVLFVFVAGFFFEHLAYKFDYRNYLGKKIKNVLLPYLIMSAPSVVDGATNPRVYGAYPQLAGTSVPYRLGWFLVNGGAGINRALWFIPMITLFYVAAPLFMLFVRQPRLYGLLVVLIPLSALAHRGAYPNLDTLGLAVYYLSAYVTGMWVSHRRATVEPLVERWWPWLMGLWCVAAVAMIVFADHHGNYEGIHLFSREHGLVDWLFVQKLLLCFALLGVMRRYEQQVAQPLAFLGGASFAVFFVHYYFVDSLRHALEWLSAETGNPVFITGSVAGWFVGYAVVLGLSVAVVKLLMLALGRKRSRYVIGS